MESSEEPPVGLTHLSDGLKRLAESVPFTPGIDLTKVGEGDVILFTTANSFYTFRVGKPADSKANAPCTGEMQGISLTPGQEPKYFREPAEDVMILGATIGGSALVMDQAKLDMRLRIRVPLETPDTLGHPHKMILTSPLKSIKHIEASAIGS